MLGKNLVAAHLQREPTLVPSGRVQSSLHWEVDVLALPRIPPPVGSKTGQSEVRGMRTSNGTYIF